MKEKPFLKSKHFLGNFPRQLSGLINRSVRGWILCKFFLTFSLCLFVTPNRQNESLVTFGEDSEVSG